MTKETVRYPDEVVETVESIIDDGVFESKSEFYRFSAEYVLDAILPDYEPEAFEFEEILEELEAEHDLVSDGDLGGEVPFLEAVLRVRRLAMRGEFDEAESFIDGTYDPEETEAVVLEELLASHRPSPG